ncbi:MAG: PorV/PorQ family protein, partial [Calditrichaeota bacterium]|nr:PorV/PorQ family protein [Calditrichota bacterium]
CALAFAGDKTKLGTAGGLMLQIQASPRGMALGESHYATVSGLEAIFFNPAGLNEIANMAFSVSTMSYFVDMNINQMAYSLKLGEFTAVAFGFKSLNVGDIDVTTYDSKEGTGEILNVSMNHLTVTYSQKFTDRVSFGITGGLYTEDYVGVSGNAVTFDLGLQYHTKSNVSLGIVIKNLGSKVNFSGTIVESTKGGGDRTPSYLGYEQSALPTEFKLALSYDRSIDDDNSVSFMGSYTNANQGLNYVSGGFEYNYSNQFFGRLSYGFQDESDLSLWSGFAAGFGVNFSTGDNSSLSIDYAYRDMNNSDIGNGVHSFGASLTF